MSGRPIEPERYFRCDLLALVALLALGLPGPGPAAAPPVVGVPGPRPLFDLEDVYTTDPVHMAMAVVGGSTVPGVGPLSSAAVLVAGHQVKTWNLEGAMTNRYHRWSLGAATLAGTGFGPGPALGQFGVLTAGEGLDLWTLIDTDRLRPLPHDWLHIVRDGPRLGEGSAESDVYSRILTRAFYTSPAAFKAHARTDLTFIHLRDSPERYRGEVVHLEGRLGRVNRFDPPYDAASRGVSDLYEAWVYGDYLGSNPYCVVFSHWPEGLPRSLLGQAKLSEKVRVRLDGYFFKTVKYKGIKGVEYDALWVVGHSVTYLPPAAVVEEPPGGWIRSVYYGFIGMLGALALGVFGVTYWYRRTDTSVRRRLMARAPEFALPPPDNPPPPAAAVAVPVRPMHGVDRPAPLAPRLTFPSTGKGGDGRGEGPAATEGPPPDEGAGA